MDALVHVLIIIIIIVVIVWLVRALFFGGWPR